MRKGREGKVVATEVDEIKCERRAGRDAIDVKYAVGEGEGEGVRLGE